MKCKIMAMAILGIFLFTLTTEARAEKKKILYVDSYHAGYEWSDGITRGIMGALNVKRQDDGTLDASASDIKLKIIRMDTKRNASEDFKQEAALQAKAEIEAWNPDVVITSDDNAAKYLVAPYLKDTNLPVVFCGVDWDASEYGFPAKNVTGMIEVSLIPQLLNTMKPFAKGQRIGYLAHDNLTNRKSLRQFTSVFHLDITPEFAATFDDWKAGYLNLQEKVDMIILSPTTFSDWDDQAALNFVEAHIEVPTGTYQSDAARFALISYVKIPEEQGEWAAKTAMDILSGASPADIPVATNTKGRVYLNMILAKKLGVKFPLNLVKIATIIK